NPHPGDPVGRTARDVPPGEYDLASHRLQRAGDQVIEGALAGAVRSDEPEQFARLHRHADIVHGPQRTEAVLEIADFEHARHNLGFRPPARRASAPASPLGKYSMTMMRTAL